MPNPEYNRLHQREVGRVVFELWKTVRDYKGVLTTSYLVAVYPKDNISFLLKRNPDAWRFDDLDKATELYENDALALALEDK